MWAIQMDLLTAFCVSAVAMFAVSLSIMMLVVYLRRPKPDSLQSQGRTSEIVYMPTTVQNSSADAPKNGDVAKPLLIGFEKVTADVPASVLYPFKELEPLKEDARE